MTEWSRERAVDRVEDLLETVESETMPVPVREVWVFGDVALGLDPVERIDVYLTKDILVGQERTGGRDDGSGAGRRSGPPLDHDIEGIGQTVRAAWADRFPEYIRAGTNGYAAPAQCLAAHLCDPDEPIHLEVCNAGFENNVTQRLDGATARERYTEILDPRGVCLWVDGRRAEDALQKLRAGEYAFPPLAGALEMLGLDEETAEEAATAVEQFRAEKRGSSVRGDVV